MKGFILEENLPRNIRFSPSLPLKSIRDLGKSHSDQRLWDFARDNELVIVTKDADFSDRIIASSPPPWVIHLRIGNMRRDDFHAFLAGVWSKLEESLKTGKLINVFHDRIETVG